MMTVYVVFDELRVGDIVMPQDLRELKLHRPELKLQAEGYQGFIALLFY